MILSDAKPILNFTGYFVKVEEDNSWIYSTKKMNGKNGEPLRLAIRIDQDGYRTVKLVNCTCRRHVKIARAVCLTFHGLPPRNKTDASHVDGNRCNDLPDNLIWKTHKANLNDIYRHREQRKKMLDLFEEYDKKETVGADLNDNNILPF